MKRWLLGFFLLLATTGCGDEECNQLFGSAAAGGSLAFDDVGIQWIKDTETLRVRYRASAGFPAVFSADLRDLVPGTGLKVDLAEVVGAAGMEQPRGNVERALDDGRAYAKFASGTLTLDAWGGDAEGSFFVRLEDGTSINGDFCGPVDEIDL